MLSSNINLFNRSEEKFNKTYFRAIVKSDHELYTNESILVGTNAHFGATLECLVDEFELVTSIGELLVFLHVI